ncbi:LysM peptidoglycan-binding domain-containing protein, partial [Methylobacterium sp. WL18]
GGVRSRDDGAGQTETPSALSRDAAGARSPAGAGAVFVPEITTAKITRGDNLWRISQRTYGRGERYTVIYDANQGQIRDPDRIYPGQIFILPTDKRG